MMSHLYIHPERVVGTMLPMHAVNNGPIIAGADQCRGNDKAFAAAGIPFVRNHDASFFASYGSDHTVDIAAVFPNFDKDPYDPASYDFAVTDHYLSQILSVGAQVFYRLGNRIEHYVKKYNILPPKDYHKWAVVCEHIIRHYNEGWANGFHHNILYWEIWNEPDLDPDDAKDKRTWGGTFDEFLPLFEITAKHLKSCFPALKIGGPAMANTKDISGGSRCDRFLSYMREHEVPMDFFSWHVYGMTTEKIVGRAQNARAVLDRHGYTETESILNEWNYVENWTDRFVNSIEAIISERGAAFSAAVMTACQDLRVDMLMYYDVRPCAFNGLFDFYTYRPLKGYDPFLVFNDLYRKGTQVAVEGTEPDLYAVAAKGEDGSVSAMITYFADPEVTAAKTVTVDCSQALTAYLTDKTHTMESVGQMKNGKLSLTMEPNSILYLRK